MIIDILRQVGQYEVVALTDPDPRRWGSQFCGVTIIGDDQVLPSLFPKVGHAFVGVGSVRSDSQRPRLFRMVRELNFEIVNSIHPAAVLSPTVRLGMGVAIMAGTIVNPDASMGNNVIVNTGAIIDHDCVVGDRTHVAPGVCFSGGVRVGDDCHIGLGACLLQGIVVGDHATVGAGAVVDREVAEGTTVAGVPAKPIHESTGGSEPFPA